MVYSFHHFYYWSKGGVETSQAYRTRLFRQLGIESKVIFATTFLQNDYVDEINSLGYEASETMWLYGAFTDCKYTEYSYTYNQFKESIGYVEYTEEDDGQCITIRIPESGIRYVVELVKTDKRYIKKVIVLVNECLLRIDYYTDCRAYSDCYHPMNGSAEYYMRRFYNSDASIAYDVIKREEKEIYKFSDRVLFTREELVAYFFERLKLTQDDTVIIDCEPGNIDLSAFIDNAYPAKVVTFLHANHYVFSDDDTICWYYFYEYAFAHPEKVNCFVVNTEIQRDLLEKQLEKYKSVNAKVVSIPASGIDSLIYPQEARKKHSIISAGRLAEEKHFDLLIKAVAKLREKYDDIKLDIYGEGSKKESLNNLIYELGCGDCIRLMGYKKLDDIYKKYDIYVSSSESETLGVTLLEALGSGLPLVALDAPYGAPNFVTDGETGFLVKKLESDEYAETIEKLFEVSDMELFRFNAYEKAALYLTKENKMKWRSIL